MGCKKCKQHEALMDKLYIKLHEAEEYAGTHGFHPKKGKGPLARGSIRANQRLTYYMELFDIIEKEPK